MCSINEWLTAGAGFVFSYAVVQSKVRSKQAPRQQHLCIYLQAYTASSGSVEILESSLTFLLYDATFSFTSMRTGWKWSRQNADMYVSAAPKSTNVTFDRFAIWHTQRRTVCKLEENAACVYTRACTQFALVCMTVGNLDK